MKVPNWAGFSRIGPKEYIAVFCFTVVLALLMLILSAFLPQSIIQGHVVDSIDLVYQDLENNYLFDKSEASKMDVLTEITMLRTSLTTNDNYLGSVLTNPIYVYDDLEEWEGAAETLANLIFISARERENIDNLKDLFYERIKQMHTQKYPYNDFLFQDYGDYSTEE